MKGMQLGAKFVFSYIIFPHFFNVISNFSYFDILMKGIHQKSNTGHPV